jgi:tight adherence protein B
VPVSIFLLMFTWVLLAIALGLRFYEWWRKREMTAMLAQAARDPAREGTKLLRDLDPAKKPALDAWLERVAALNKIEAIIRQSGLDWTAKGLCALMAAGGIAGMVLGQLLPAFVDHSIMSVILAVILSTLPYLYLRRKRAGRLRAFEEQFPDALDFLARSMRAGHALTVSLKMVGEDSPEPLGMEFRTLFHQQNLGVPLDRALMSLADRVPLLDVRFFVSAVTLQKQTGGNLGEILTRLAQVIRERFQLKGQVKAASAHGRVTSAVLVLMPLATTVLMLVLAPGYLQSMAKDPDGRWLIAGALAGQIVGQLLIRKIINIKV